MSDTTPSSVSVATRESQIPGEDALTHASRSEWMRQVHLVRKQEFAYLRGVQKRNSGEITEPTLAGLTARLPSEGKVRGDTLKKIDEIEAQLDLLWVASHSKRVDSPLVGSTGLSDAGSPTQFSSTYLATPGVLTQMMHHSELPASVLLVKSLEDLSENSITIPVQAAANTGAASKGLTLSGSGTEPLDETLTKAAQFFAQKNYELAAQHLVRSLRDNDLQPGQALRRLLALLDIYRATGNQAQFDWSVLEYFDFWDGRTPQWQQPSYVAREVTEKRQNAFASQRPDKSNQSFGAHLWRCPGVLTQDAASDLQMHWSQGGHCTIDWTSLTTIDAGAAALVTSVFNSEQGSPEQLTFMDTPNLLYVLEQATPIGASEVDRHLWLLRFCMLGLMGMRAAFDSACTDFCLTYIETAPVWRPGTVQFIGDTQSTAPVAPSTTGNSPWQLQGHVTGETGLGLPEPASGSVDVDCSTLVRMDAAATALLLDWLRQTASRGIEVQFNHVGVLLGAAWNAAGVEVFAHVQLRDVL